MDVTLSNFGMMSASGVSAQLTCSNSSVTILDDIDSWGTIASGSSGLVTNAFSVNIADDNADLENINYELTENDNNSNSWTSYFSTTAHAPAL